MITRNEASRQEEKIPVVIGRPYVHPAYRILRVEVKCPFCGRIHTHGAEGRRRSHCYAYNLDCGGEYKIKAQIGAQI